MGIITQEELRCLLEIEIEELEEDNTKEIDYNLLQEILTSMTTNK